MNVLRDKRGYSVEFVHSSDEMSVTLTASPGQGGQTPYVVTLAAVDGTCEVVSAGSMPSALFVENVTAIIKRAWNKGGLAWTANEQ